MIFVIILLIYNLNSIFDRVETVFIFLKKGEFRYEKEVNLIYNNFLLNFIFLKIIKFEIIPYRNNTFISLNTKLLKKIIL